MTEGTNLLLITCSAFYSSSRWPLATQMRSRRQRSIPLGGRYRQVSLYQGCWLTAPSNPRTGVNLSSDRYFGIHMSIFNSGVSHSFSVFFFHSTCDDISQNLTMLVARPFRFNYFLNELVVKCFLCVILFCWIINLMCAGGTQQIANLLWMKETIIIPQLRQLQPKPILDWHCFIQPNNWRITVNDNFVMFGIKPVMILALELL